MTKTLSSQKLLNWITGFDNLDDFELMRVTITADRENPNGKFPKERAALYSKASISRRNVLNRAAAGLVKQWADGRLGKKLSDIPQDQLPTLIFCDIDESQQVVQVVEWLETETWKFQENNYWVVGKWNESPTATKKFEWMAIIPRRGMSNSPAVRYLQPIKVKSSVEITEEQVDEAFGEFLTFMQDIESYLTNPESKLGSKTIYFMAKINLESVARISPL